MTIHLLTGDELDDQGAVTSVVALLEHALEQARGGHIRAVGLIALRADGTMSIAGETGDADYALSRLHYGAADLCATLLDMGDV